jgi:2-oxoacid dehydrogenases acyltransferase (catalytic domain)
MLHLPVVFDEPHSTATRGFNPPLPRNLLCSPLSTIRHPLLGTFTISNLGMFGVSQFDAILPPGTGSILAIAASTPKVVQLKNGHLGVQKSMTVTITCDHRHIYGADAAEFLKDLAGNGAKRGGRVRSPHTSLRIDHFLYFCCVKVFASQRL